MVCPLEGNRRSELTGIGHAKWALFSKTMNVRRCLILGAVAGVAAWLVYAISKEGTKVEDPEDFSRMIKRSDNLAESKPGGGGESVVENPFAEKRWPEGEEVENEWTERFKEARTAEERLEGMGLKQASGPEDLDPLLRLALRDPDESVRQEAAKMISSFAGVTSGSRAPVPGRRPSRQAPGGGGGAVDGGTPETGEGGEPSTGGVDAILERVADLVVGAAHDPSADVRTLAMEAVMELPPEAQLEIYGRTLFVEDEGVRRMTVTELGRMHNKDAFETLLNGLSHPDPGFLDVVNGEIKLLVHRSFASFEEARMWWGDNAPGYAENMVDLGNSR